MPPLHCEEDEDVIAALMIVRVALTDFDIRELVLDQMDLTDEEAKRILAKVNESLLEVGCDP